MGDGFISFPCPNINMPDYSLRPLMDCTCRRVYFHSVKSTLEPVSHAMFLQHYHVWLCSLVVLMFGIRILRVGCLLQLSCIVCMNHQWCCPL
jgi:hypothetical protein